MMEANSDDGQPTSAVCEVCGRALTLRELQASPHAPCCDEHKPATTAPQGSDNAGAPAAIAAKLELARHDLLELTTRTRLLDTPRLRERSRSVEIIDERCDDVFRILAGERRAMVFDPSPEDSAETRRAADEAADEDSFDYEEDDLDADGLQARYTDNRLQTPYAEKALHKRLLAMYYDARTYEEEHGVGILYLALGFLKWFDSDSSDHPRHAPLILLPVALERQSARKRFKVTFAGDELTANLSLQAKLKADFGVKLPDVGDLDESTPSDYFQLVQDAVSGVNRWEILPNDMQLGFFSFTKFLMYRDLDPGNWPPNASIRDHPLIQSLLGGGFESPAPICGDSERIDALIDPAKTFHILNADSSQALAIEEVSRGRKLVIQGPPGTGKSQTIANLIATAVKDGKTVLFVAEKLAALNVVKSRLDNLKLGDMCLELHSHKTQKRAVLDDLGRTLNLGKPVVGGIDRNLRDLRRARDALNEHAARMHQLLEPAQVSAYRVMGELVRLSAAGVAPPDFELEGATDWTREDFLRKRELLAEVAQCIEEIGPPTEHIWRGVGLDAVLPTDALKFAAASREVHEKLTTAVDRANRVADALGIRAPGNMADAARLAKLAMAINSAPDADFLCLATPVWSARGDEIRQLVTAGQTLAQVEPALCELVADIAWTTDLAGARSALAAHGRSWLRFLNREYRRANAELRGILNGPPPKRAQDRIELLDRIIYAQEARKVLREQSELGREAFGARFRERESDWDMLSRIVDWVQQQAAGPFAKDFRRALGAVKDRDAFTAASNQLTEQIKQSWSSLKDLLKRLALDVTEAFDEPEAPRVAFSAIVHRLQQWAKGDSPASWIAYRIRRTSAADAGLGELSDRLDQGDLAPQDSLDKFDSAYYSALMRRRLSTHPALAQFRGASHEEVIERFRRLDRERIELARTETALAHYEGLPRQAGDAGDVGVVKREIAKKRRLLPIRKLMAQAGRAVQAIKPVFMMSPLSVAQYLEPGGLEFDLLLIDEASQVRPVEALGAIARARQFVVVGDDRQLPPTRFFNRYGEDGGGSESEDDFQASDIESVLGLCRAQNVPDRMLSWHYRSRHHSLIAVSNREYYDGRLYVLPSPTPVDEDMGLRFHHVRDGVYDRGGTSTNRKEAEAVARAALDHAAMTPHLTLGIGTFSVQQRDAVRNELERLRREHPETEDFFAEEAKEPFFVKNLETIQGDERDVVLISVGYGPDTSGVVMMNFGPLNAQGGERRLNVLMTRARRRCEVFSSITEDDIDLTRAKGLGPRGLKMFLQYARSGQRELSVPSGKDFESPFEEAVGKAIERLGYLARPQVGVAGFFIDIGVADPQQPGRFLLGVECDGASYHSARWARDRDRLRQTLLEDRGWTIHRIWSTDWFQDPEGQTRRLAEAIERARVGKRVATDTESPGGEPDCPAPRIVRMETGDEETTSAETGFAVPYEEANFKIDLPCEAHEIPLPVRRDLAIRIVEIEQPVHAAEITRRFAQLAGAGRAGARIAAAVDEALQSAKRERKLFSQDEFYTTSRQIAVKVRDRACVESRGLRKPEHLPPQEIAAAVVHWVTRHLRVARDEIPPGVSRVFGFGSTGRHLRERIDQQVDRLLREGLLVDSADRISVADPGGVADADG